MTARVFIDGEAGTTGLGIRDQLARLPNISLISLPPERRKDTAARREAMAAVDVAILCLPDEAAREAVAIADELGANGPRLLDASSAHRVAAGWVYGFPELVDGQGRAIGEAAKVSNPGCYATGAIALLRPLVDAGLIPAGYPISLNAISGYSGGGKAMIAAHEADGGPAFELYALGLEHKHVPEIEHHARLSRRPLFVPSVGHFRQGMLVSLPLHLDTLPGHVTTEDLWAALADRYAASPAIRVLPATDDNTLEPEALNDTNQLELFVFGGEKRRHALLVARLDNLGKGASGAAVRNLHLMLDQTLQAEDV